MQINWKLKSAIYKVIDTFGLKKVLYWGQKRLTGRSRVKIKNISPNWQIHEKHLKGLENPVLLEFGAGKNLRQNIYLSRLTTHQIVVDLHPMLDLEQFNEAARQIAALVPDITYHPCHSVQDVQTHYGIEYIAPFDMTRANLPDSSIDCCISTDTLEHVPETQLKKILPELKRVLKTGGLISARIDYSDHYAHTDKSIGLLNFLSYSSKAWRKHNHASHYQNRLRHYDFQRLFDEAGLERVVDEVEDTAPLPQQVDPRFDEKQPTVNATSGVFLLRI